MKAAHQKIERIRTALAHNRPDRVPAGEFFWSGFINRCQKKWGSNFDPYRFWDLDYIVITPNMDPHIRTFDVEEHANGDLFIKTGFGACIRRSGAKPMPHYESFSINDPAEMMGFVFDNPADKRRFFTGGDDQINCVGDTLLRNLPPWDSRLDAYKNDFCLFGSLCEPYEYLWRIIGTEQALFWMAAQPDLLRDFVDRIGEFLFLFAKAQIASAKGRLSGMYIWGDVAYRNGMLFNPDVWRRVFKPHVKKLIDLCHEHKLVVIYHGCGDARLIYNDFVEMGLDAYNPLEAKAGLDVVEIKRQFGTDMAFCGNIDVRILEQGHEDAIRSHVLYKLQAAQNGGWIFQSDHSVSSDVAPEIYDHAIRILRQHGNYPLNLK